jgi:hypothetical protein
MNRLECSFFSSDIINIDVKKRGLLFQTNNKTKKKFIWDLDCDELNPTNKSFHQRLLFFDKYFRSQHKYVCKIEIRTTQCITYLYKITPLRKHFTMILVLH